MNSVKKVLILLFIFQLNVLLNIPFNNESEMTIFYQLVRNHFKVNTFAFLLKHNKNVIP